MLITSTIKGVAWIKELEGNEDQYNEQGYISARNGTQSILVTNETLLEPFTLKLEYKIEAYALLGIPILISLIVSILFLAVLGYVIH